MILIRAMNLSEEPGKENFAIHLQKNGERTTHAISTGLVELKTGGHFPKKLWVVAEELCKQLSTLEVENSADVLLFKAALKSAGALKETGHADLAEGLLAIAAPTMLPRRHRLLRIIEINLSQRKRSENGALDALIDAFKRAFHDLVEINGTPGTSDLARIEQFYEQLIPRTKRFCCYPSPPLPAFRGSLANIYSDAPFLENHPKDATKGHLLEREALAHGLSVLRFPNGSFIASDRNGNRLNFKWSRSPISSAVALALCNHKEATRARLARCGLPVPRGRVFGIRDLDTAVAYASRIGYPVVVKPAAGVRGIGVVTNIQNEEELKEAFRLYTRNPLGLDDLIVEQHVMGEDYRIVVVGDEVISAIRREPASVIGDGLHTVADLILFKNRIRLMNPHLRKRLIQYDEVARQRLARENLTLTSVPAKDQWLQLAYSNNISRGGDSIEVADQLHPSIRAAAIRAVKAIPKLEFCGLDFLLEDHTKPLSEQTAAIVELNAHGAIGTGQYPIWGTPRNVARKFLLHCAKTKGIELTFPPAERLSLQLKVRGRVTGVDYRRWLSRKAEEYGVTASASNADRMTVKATLEGQVAPVAALANAAVRGPQNAAPFWVAIEHVEGEARAGKE